MIFFYYNIPWHEVYAFVQHKDDRMLVNLEDHFLHPTTWHTFVLKEYFLYVNVHTVDLFHEEILKLPKSKIRII